MCVCVWGGVSAATKFGVKLYLFLQLRSTFYRVAPLERPAYPLNPMFTVEFYIVTLGNSVDPDEMPHLAQCRP